MPAPFKARAERAPCYKQIPEHHHLTSLPVEDFALCSTLLIARFSYRFLYTKGRQFILIVNEKKHDQCCLELYALLTNI